MKITRFVNIMICYTLLATLISCGGIQVYTDYDETLNYDQFHSYNFYKNLETNLDQLDEKRVVEALKGELKQKEFYLDSLQPDFRINVYSDQYKKNKQHNIGINIGTYGRHVGGSIGSGIPIRSSEQIISLTIEFADGKTNELFWQGVTESPISPNIRPEERSDLFKKMIKKVLKKYPPQ